MYLIKTFLILTIVAFACLGQAARPDEHGSCGFWAAQGECTSNPGYMMQSCATSCDPYRATSDKLSKPIEFYDIIETDINGNEVRFSDFQGKVVYLVNVASQCGYTQSNYKEFQDLESKFSAQGLIIVLAPCNSFGSQEPGDARAIEHFARDTNHFNGLILSKGEVNGENARPSFNFLKAKTGKRSISWNFDGKFLVDRQGQVILPQGDVGADIQTLIERGEGVEL